MTRSTRRTSSRRKRDVYDFLRKQHRDCLAKERQALMSVDPVLWYLRRAPYPLDADTAAAFRGAVSRFVLSNRQLRFDVEEWVLPDFDKEWMKLHSDDYDTPRTLSMATSEDCHQLVFCCDEAPPLGHFANDFVERCDEAVETIFGLARETEGLASTCVSTPYLPFGHRRHYLPLIDHVWIDLRFLELVEACAFLHEKGFARLPAIDPHPLAWHRFFPPQRPVGAGRGLILVHSSKLNPRHKRT
jgi:hypothetical protein